MFFKKNVLHREPEFAMTRMTYDEDEDVEERKEHVEYCWLPTGKAMKEQTMFY